jgi:phage terminase large subunit-like protein
MALWARPDQLPPEGNWRTWLLLGGRGSGKTRSAAEWCRAEVESGRRVQLGIVGPTVDALRRVQIEGPSGLLATAPPWFRPTYEPSRRVVTWPNGVVAHLFSAEEPDRLRGPNLDGAWCDEVTSWASAADVWDMLQMCLRIPGPQGHAPQVLVSTTPKPTPMLKAIIAAPAGGGH